MKRVTGNYYIPDFSKGLIDDASKGRIDENYKRKCTELKNFWIKNNNNIAKRPPLRQIEGFEDIRHVIDFVETQDRFVFLRQVDLNSIPTEPRTSTMTDAQWRAYQSDRTRARRMLLEEIGWRPGTNVNGAPRIFNGSTIRAPGTGDLRPSTNLSPDDPSDFAVWEFLTATPAEHGNQTPEAREGFPIVTRLESYTKDTKELIHGETMAFVDLIPTQHAPERTLQWGLTTDELPGAFNTNLLYTDTPIQFNASNFSAAVRSYTDFDALTDAQKVEAAQLKRASQIATEIGRQLATPPVFSYIIQGGAVLSSRVNMYDFNHPQAGYYFSNLDADTRFRQAFQYVNIDADNPVSRNYRIERSLFKDLQPPRRITLTADGKAVQIVVQGQEQIWDKGELTPKIPGTDILNESTMNTFAQKPIVTDIEDLEVVGKMIDVTDTFTSATAVAGQGEATPSSTLRSLIKRVPDINKLVRHLKFSLFMANSAAVTDPLFGHIAYMVPDIQITEPGSDVMGAGAFLETINYNNVEYNAFVAHGLENKFATRTDARSLFLTTDATHKDETAENFKDQNDDNEINKYPNGAGSAIGELGVYIYLQRANRIDPTTGLPVFYPLPTSFGDNTADSGKEDENIRLDRLANTDYILYLTLDATGPKVRALMDDLQLISVYGANGKSGFNAVGGIQLGDFLAPTYASDSPIAKAIPKINLNAGSAQEDTITRHVLPWGQHEYFEAYWAYAMSRHITLASDAEPTYESWEDDGDIASDSKIFPEIEVGSNMRDVLTAYTPLNSDDRREHLLTSALVDSRKTIEVTEGRRNSLRQRLAATTESQDRIRLLNRVSTVTLREWRRARRADPDRNIFEKIRDFFSGPELESGVPGVSYDNFTDIILTTHTGSSTTLFTVDGHGHSAIDLLRQRDADFTEYNLNLGTRDVNRTKVEIYVSSATVNFEYTNASGATATQTISRNPGSNTYYVDLRRDWERELESGNAPTQLRPKFVNIVNYYQDTETRNIPANNRLVKLAGNTASFSEVLTANNPRLFPKFSQGYLQYLEATPTAGRHSAYMRGSNLGADISIYDRTRTPQEPQQLFLSNKDFSDVNVVDYIESARSGLLLTDQRVHAVSGFNNIINSRIIHESGVSIPALSDESMIIGAEGDKVKVVRYYEEAGGYITDIVNNELTLPGNIVNGVSLINKHRVILFQVDGDSKNIYTMSVDNQRQVKGFSKLEMPFDVFWIKRKDDDRVYVQCFDQPLMELDFDRDYNTDEHKWQDALPESQIRFNLPTTYQTYEAAVTTMPVLQVYAEDFSLLKTTQLRYLVAGVNGHPAFSMQITDGTTGNKTRLVDFRHTRANEVNVDQDFSGQIVVKNMPQNGGSQPELRLTKDDDEYIEFSSVNIQLGG